MVHTLVPMSVKIKIKNFETPARLINHMDYPVQLVWHAARLRSHARWELQEWGSKSS